MTTATYMELVGEILTVRDVQPAREAMRNDLIDHHRVDGIHLAVHERLLNWARWAKPGRGCTGLHPMFRQYRSTETTMDPQDAAIPIDGTDGQRVEKVVIAIPEAHRMAVQWHYVFSFVPIRKMCRVLVVTERGLLELVTDGRSMVKNRLR